MTIDISANAARVSYSLAAGASQAAFTVSFEFFEDSDLKVYVDEVLKSVSTHYAVSGGSGSTGTVTFGSALVGISGGSKITITRSTVIERTSDFSSGADINRAALNTQLDTLTAIAADNRDRVTRTMSVPDSEVTPVLVLPSVANRKGKLLGFNSSSGNVEAGPVLSEVVTLAAISANITSVAGKATEIGRLGTADAVSDMNVLGTADFVSDLNTLAAISGNITTVAGVASAVSGAPANATAAANSATAAASSASGASSSATAAASSAAAAAASFDSFDDRYLGSKSSEPSVDNDGNSLVEGALYFNSSSNSMQVFDGSDFIAASSAGTASLILYEYTASNNQTTFSGNDTNSATLSYTVLNIQVVVNGAILDPSDYTATSGTSVVLAAGAALNDVVNIYAFKSFSVSDTVSASSGGTFAANVTVNGNIVVSGTVDGRDVASDGTKLNGIEAAADVTDATNVAAAGALMDSELTNLTAVKAISATPKQIGKESIWIPAAAMYPSTTNPCSGLEQVETTALRPDLKVLDFAAAADDFAQFAISFPKSWNLGTITYQPFWTVTGTNTGTVVWQLGGIAVSSDDTINTAFGTLVATTALAHSGTSNDLMVSAESGAVTIAGSPADNDQCFFQINNDTSASGQTGVVRLLGIKLFFTTDAANDA